MISHAIATTGAVLVLTAGLLLLALAVLACGPAAAPDSDRNAGIQSPPAAVEVAPAPTNNSQSAPQAEPTIEPTAVPKAPPITADPGQDTPATDVANEDPPPPMSMRFMAECQEPGFNLFNNAMTDSREDFIECYAIQVAAYEPWLGQQTGTPTFAQVQQAYQAVQQVVVQDAAVVRDYANVLTCIDRIGYARPDGSWMFPWQDFLTAEEYATKVRGLSDEQWAAFFRLYYASDHCAGPTTDYYLSQAVAWKGEVTRLKSADASAVQPLIDAGIVAILERPSPVSGVETTPYFLTLAGRNVLLDGSGTNELPPPTPEPAPSSLTRSQGLTGCSSISPFTSNHSNMKRFAYCVELVLDAVNACRGTGLTTQERDELALRSSLPDPTALTAREKACADRLVAGWSFPPLTLASKCTAFTDFDAFLNCAQTSELALSEERMLALYDATREAGDRTPAVQAAHARVVQCLSAKGFTNPPNKLLYHWQRSELASGRHNWLKTLTPAKLELMTQLETPTHECAVQHNYYAVQDKAWAAAASTLVAQSTTHAQSSRDWAFLSGLQESGTSAFFYLTLP